jgi:hypothetical protein
MNLPAAGSAKTKGDSPRTSPAMLMLNFIMSVGIGDVLGRKEMERE